MAVIGYFMCQLYRANVGKVRRKVGWGQVGNVLSLPFPPNTYSVVHLARCTTTLSPVVGALASRQKHTLPDLTYDYGALEPHICAEIMQLHHSKHHATYVNNLNVTEEKYQEALAKGEPS